MSVQTEERDNIIAEYLGWFQDGLPGSWYIQNDKANYVVYSVHNNYPHRDLPFSRDWNWMMKVLEKINESHNAGIKARDLTYTIKYLLNGGYFPNSTEKLPPLIMSLEALYIRASYYIECTKN